MPASSFARRRRAIVVLCAVLLAAVSSSSGLAAQRSSTAPPTVTATGCVSQPPDAGTAPPTGHEQGAALGLTLSRATIKSSDGRAVDAPARSAVPGSLPAGSGSGTTDAAASRAATRVEQSFWLVGAKAAELTRFVGKRVELSGTIDDRLAANSGMPGVTDAGAAAARRAATASADPPVAAHPSAPSRAIAVVSFRVVGDACP